MITIFSTPKDFINQYQIIQNNAFESWRALSPEIQIIILGNSIGSKNAAKSISADYIPNVLCSYEGTPLLSNLFYKAQEKAKYSVMLFINSDIILELYCS